MNRSFVALPFAFALALAFPFPLVVCGCSGADPTLLDAPSATATGTPDDPPPADDAAAHPDVTQLPLIDDDASTSTDTDAATLPDAAFCATYAPPNEGATCHACTGSSCQTNGCFGGYYCDLDTAHCVPRPDGC